jgi:hypothetical protein
VNENRTPGAVGQDSTSNAVGKDKVPGGPNDVKSPSGGQQVAAVLAALAATAAAVTPVISLIDGTRVTFNTGLCLVIAAAAIGAGIAVLTVQRSSWYRKWWRRLKPVSALVALVAMLGVGISLILASPKSASTPPSCRPAAGVSGAATSAPAFTVKVNLRCAAPTSNQLFLVVQLLDEGKKGTVKHSEYYLAWDLKNMTGPQEFADTPSGCTTRRYYVISVSPDQLAPLLQSQKTASGSYYGEPIDTLIGKYVISNEETNRSCQQA